MKNIVTIGGGTGSFTVLSGLKKLENVSLKALVSMADDGGSTGVLMDELGILPPGDVRQCLVALSEHSDKVRELISYRFSEGALKGHSFGNIFLAALEKVTGDFNNGVEIASEILKVRGTVIPITSNKAELIIKLKNGEVLKGENKINHYDFQDIGIEKIFYENNVALNESAKNAILEANYIVLGPGNYYCSLTPNLIVSGFKEALNKSKAKIILPINLTNKQGHTMHWKVSTYVKQTEEYIDKKVDFVLINNENPSKEQIERYKLEEGDGVLMEDDFVDDRAVRAPLLSHNFVEVNPADAISGVRSFIRHNGDNLAKTIMSLFDK